MKTGLLYGIVASSKTRVRCLLCGVHIPKATKCIEQHTQGVKHKENLELLSENGITVKEDVVYCKPCNLELPEDDSISNHIESDDHSNWMTMMEDLLDGEFISVDHFLASDKDEVYCEVCKSNVLCTLLSIEAHVNGLPHRTNVVNFLKPFNGLFPVDNDDEVWCKVCNLYVENDPQSILYHLDDDNTHLDWFYEIEDMIENQEINIRNYLSNEHEMNAYCLKCEKEVACDAQSLEAHINSSAHFMKFIIE